MKYCLKFGKRFTLRSFSLSNFRRVSTGNSHTGENILEQSNMLGNKYQQFKPLHVSNLDDRQSPY